MNLDELAAEKTFLGEEFLTWLWYRCLRDGGEFELGDGRRVGVVVDDYLALAEASADGRGPEHTIKRGAPARSAEARTAFLAGKRVRSMKVVMGTSEGDWSCKIGGRDLDLTSLKVPPLNETHPDDRALEKLQSFEDAWEVLDGLYALFLEERLAPTWDEEVVPEMRGYFERVAAL